MTIDEAIFCMKSYLPNSRVLCQDCKYYGSEYDDGAWFCHSSDAHKLAIKALYWLKRTKMKQSEGE